MKISLAMIVRNGQDNIRTCIESANAAVDEVVVIDTGSTDGTIDAIRAARPDAKIETWIDPNRHPTEGWISNFSIPRNLSFEKASGDVILWLDHDDTLESEQDGNPADMLRQVIDGSMEYASQKADFLEMRYHYIKDQWGNVVLSLPRFRVVRRGAFQWVWPVHEDLKPTRFVKRRDLRGHALYIDHHRVHERSTEPARRNLWIMERHLASGGAMDSRLWQNVAGSFSALSRWKEAIEAYDKSLGIVGSDSESAFVSQIRKGEAFCQLQQPEQAADAYLRAQLLFPERRYPWLKLAELCADVGQMQAALTYSDIAEAMPTQQDGFVHIPVMEKSAPLQVKAQVYVASDKLDKALECYSELLKLFPGDKNLEEQVGKIRDVLATDQLGMAYRAVASSMGLEQAKELWRMAPQQLATTPEALRARRPARPKDKPSIVFWCGKANELWSPASVAKGIGGSEEAVIFLSRELAALGWHVEVYADPPSQDIGLDDHGVLWQPYYVWEAQDSADVFVGWRQGHPKAAIAQGLGNRCGQRWLWLHDAIVPEYLRGGWTDALTGIFCLTEFHAKKLPDELRSKLVLTQNGINPEFLLDGPNEAMELVYASSPDRGLEYLLREWPKIKGALPAARLHIYYGFTKNWLASEASFPELRRVRSEINATKDQPGVIWHGMVGQKELSQAFADCGFWLYPTEWPETSCCAEGTLVQMPCDREKHPRGVPIESLVGKSGFPVYAYSPEEERFVLRRCNAAWMTGEDRECLDITLDDGTVLTVTPEHLIMDFDGEWHRADALKIGMRLNALHMRYNVGYKDIDGDWRDEHRLVGEWLAGRPLTSDDHVDHLSPVRLDNRPEALQVLSHSEHSRKTHSGKGARRKRSVEKQVASFREWAKTPEAQAHFKAHLGQAGRAMWDRLRAMPADAQAAWIAERSRRRGASLAAHIATDPEWAAEVEAKRRAGGLKGAKARWNHKVVSVQTSAKRHRVYDMEVEGLHNFVANGVVVHNCITAMKAQAMGCLPITSRYPLSGVPETTQYDLGPPPRDGSLYTNASWLAEWTASVIASVPRHDLGPMRESMKAWARETYSWAKVAAQWNDLFLHRSSGNSRSQPVEMTAGSAT